ncbi:MAG: hypothetical protein P8Y45_19090 [Exilibacterium sp.]
MIDPDYLYETSEPYRNLLRSIENAMEEEGKIQNRGRSQEASDLGLKVWDLLLDMMSMLEAKSFLDLTYATGDDLMCWASCFVTELHNAASKDNTYRDLKYQFCSKFVDLHKHLRDKDAHNLGFIRNELADSLFSMGKADQADALYREWLMAEPEWEQGWINWSDSYWLWRYPDLNKDYEKALSILKQGLSEPKVSSRSDLEDRLEMLTKEYTQSD